MVRAPGAVQASRDSWNHLGRRLTWAGGHVPRRSAETKSCYRRRRERAELAAFEALLSYYETRDAAGALFGAEPGIQKARADDSRPNGVMSRVCSRYAGRPKRGAR